MSVPSTIVQPQTSTTPHQTERSSGAAYARLRRRLGGAALLIALISLWVSPSRFDAWPNIASLTVLAVIVSLLPARLPGEGLATIPVIPILFSIAGLYGVTAALSAISVSVVASGFSSLTGKRRYQAKYYLPNIYAFTISIGGGALLYIALERMFFPHGGVEFGQKTSWAAWFALPLCALLAFVGNTLLVTMLASTYDGNRWDIIWYNNVRWMLPSAIFMSPVGLLTALLYNQHWWLGLGFIVVPIYALRMAAITHERTMLAYKQGVDFLGRVMQEAHPYTHGHLHRVAHWAKQIAEDMKLPAASMYHIEDAAILHDIGKVAVDDKVLNKIGKLTDEDWAMIRQHPVTGANLVAKMSIMDKASHWIRHHHERPDGRGYPSGLKGDEIPIESSIISVVDAFDAMVGGPAKEDQRPYRQPMEREAAIAELRRHAGTQFNAEVVEVFVAVLQREKELEAMGRHAVPKQILADDSLWASPPAAAVATTVGG